MKEEKTEGSKTTIEEIGTNINNRLKRIESYNKIFEGKKNKLLTEREIGLKDKELKLKDLEIESREIDNKKRKQGKGGWNSEIEELLCIARAWYVNNEKTILGSEPCIESLWDSDEITHLKDLIMAKAEKL